MPSPDIQPLRDAVRGIIAKGFERPLSSFFVAIGVGPNGVTLVGIAIAGAGAYFASTGHFLIAGLLVLLGSAFDLIDGAVARRTNQVSRRGALLDSVLDRVGESAILFGLAVHYSSPQWFDRTNLLLAFIALAGSIMISYVRARAEGLGLHGKAGFLTRPERVVIMAGALLAGYPAALLWILAVGAPLSAAQRFLAVWRLASQDTTEP